MQKEEFEKLVEDALKTIPRKFRKLLDNISVIVEDNPSRSAYSSTRTPSSHLILGTYHGVPYQHRGPFYGNVAPDVITIYQKPIEQICSTRDQIKEKIQEVIIHEIGHYFGFSDRQLYEIERDPGKKQQ